jgi:nucleotide-binding universal stress UspA family protein
VVNDYTFLMHYISESLSQRRARQPEQAATQDPGAEEAKGGEEEMRVLVATDGSPAAQEAVREATTRQWPAGTEIEVFTVVTTRIPMFPDPSFAIAAAHETLLNEAREHAPKLLEAARAMIQDAQPNVRVSVKVAEGSHAVASHAPCSVELVRARGTT